MTDSPIGMKYVYNQVLTCTSAKPALLLCDDLAATHLPILRLFHHLFLILFV